METVFSLILMVIAIALIIVLLLQVRGSGSSLFGEASSTFRSRRGVEQILFRTTIVLAVIFVERGVLLLYGRVEIHQHNAMDKIIGRSLEQLPLSNRGFLLSGRVSFEMVQKAVMAGSPCIVAIGAPTTLAIELARQHGITLIGFARESRFNVYTGAWRLRD